MWIKSPGATTDRPGLTALIGYAREGDVIVVHTLDRLGRTVRDTLNLIHDLRERGVGVRNLADPIRVDSSNPEDPMAQLAVVLLALFGQMERTYTLERAAHARAVATAKGRRVGRPTVVSEAQLAYAIQLRDSGSTVPEIIAKTGLTRSTLYRHLPPRPAEAVTAADTQIVDKPPAPTVSVSPEAPGSDERLECPSCGHRPPNLRDLIPHLDDLDTIWLLLDGHGNVSEKRHCARCQPHEQVISVDCERCGDGPLVTGTTPGADLPAPVLEWLAGRGWTTDPALVCANHG